MFGYRLSLQAGDISSLMPTEPPPLSLCVCIIVRSPQSTTFGFIYGSSHGEANEHSSQKFFAKLFMVITWLANAPV